ncbi:uncharacterized protein LOC135808933 [Sycon ciliatum]|uniref:uncharacterized protein LOC135808933 n=1 Tax=Sycon ciliatum TaxID=27933 RepID=UPI0031F620E0
MAIGKSLKKRSSQGWTKAKLEEQCTHPYNLRPRRTRQSQSVPASNGVHHGPTAGAIEVAAMEQRNSLPTHHQSTGPHMNPLESLHYDIWDCVLSFLEVRDIFRLCGASRPIRTMLMTEYTFRRLCMLRYHISPRLDVSYISTSKILYAAANVATLSRQFCWDMYSMFKRRLPRVHSEVASDNIRWRIMAYFPLLCPKAPVQKGELCAFGIDDWLPANIASWYLPNLDTDNLEKLYHVRKLCEMSLVRCGSVQVYQMDLIRSLSQETRKLVSYLPYHYLRCRLNEIVKTLSEITGNKLTYLLACLGLYAAAEPQFLFLRATQLCHVHSVLQLYIKQSLEMSIADYFAACVECREYCERMSDFLWRRTVYSKLAEHLSMPCPKHNVLTRLQLSEGFRRATELVL